MEYYTILFVDISKLFFHCYMINVKSFLSLGVPIEVTITMPEDFEGVRYDSCLTVSVHEDNLCRDGSCDNPAIVTKEVRNPLFKIGKMELEMNMPQDTVQGEFRIKAVLNNGWCTSGTESIRSGDHKNAERNLFVLRTDMAMVDGIDIEMEKYISKPVLGSKFLVSIH